ncbi:hypothetical protein AB0M95_10320 [Sphaerisporangium sp. NPDC051017]|uniref:hypothetical protein n=1 Tax=Sphaerisporangium sp. NPDC051017 TaxID=3154636 RepID=UPI00342421A0
MQKINRLPLDEAAVRQLADLTQRVTSATDPKAEAKKLWAALEKGVKERIQATLIRMSTGLERCMYCEDSQGTDIEHFRPKSAYPAHAFSWANYLLACTRCNSNHKRTRFPQSSTGDPLLIDPTTDDPVDHLLLSPSTGLYAGLDDKGVTTIDVCGLNRDVCAAGRANAWTAIECLIPSYSRAVTDSQPRRAGKIIDALRQYPFQSVRSMMSRIFREADDPALLLSAEVIEAFRSHPELL